KGQLYLTNDYDANDRIEQQAYGTGTFQFSFITNPESRITQATVTDRNQNEREDFLDAQGNVSQMIRYTNRNVRATDPVSYTTLYEHNANMERTKVIFPKGNSIEYTFDDQLPDPRARGNLRQVKRVSLTGPPYQRITAFTYESRFNRTQTTTDALNRTTTFFFDYEEGPDYLDQDLNDDNYKGGTSGNIVKVLYPTVTQGLAAPQNADQIIETKFWHNQYGQIVHSIKPEGAVDTYSYYATGTSNGYLQEIIRDINDKSVSNTFEYDTVGNVTVSRDGKGHPTTITVNELNQISETLSRGPGYIVKFHYDGNDNIDEIQIENRDAIADPTNPSLLPTWLITTY
ncbi:MAG: RHS repeat protein, partial [Planctomycetes bacterium]|nr:RHS repeat protein [Planctomycetota bacterium]